MGRVSLSAVVLWSLASVAGCASIAGLDGIQENGCPNAPNCGDSGSMTLDSSMGGDTGKDTSSGGDTTQADSSSSSGSSSGADSSSTSGSSSGAGSSSGTDSGMKDSSMADTFVWDGPPFDDAPFDSGCGSLNTTSNCGACTVACAPTGPNQTTADCCSAGICPGSTNGSNAACQYTCASGRLDCNKVDPGANTDGCECTAPSTATCCGDMCPVQHVTGLVGKMYYPPSDVFYDCIPTSSGVNIQLALDACAAYVVARGGTAATNCGEFGPTDGGPADSVCAIVSGGCGSSCMGFLGDCICWTASGMYQGQVLDPVAQGLDAQCYVGASALTFH